MSGNVRFEIGEEDADLEPVSTERASVYYGCSLQQHDDKYGRKARHHKTLKERILGWKDACTECNGAQMLQLLEKKMPGVNVIRTYKFREYFLGDVVAGLSVGILSVPLSMGFTLLASVPPIIGLYTCLYPPVVYFIFGASRHIAMGTMAISNLVIGTAVDHGTAALEKALKSAPPENRSSIIEQLEHEQISIAVSITFLSGVFLLLLSVLQLGFIVSYIGNAFISGYMTATNIRVMTHQVIHCLGVKGHLDTHVGFLHYFYLVFDVCKNIPNTNVASLITSMVTMAILLAVKYGINDRFKSKLKIPVPIEMIVVVIGLLISHFCKFHDNFGVIVAGKVPQGVPAPTMPSLKYMEIYFVESCLCGIVSFLFSAMMVKLFCQRHNYPIDKNQELLASGMCNTVGGLLCCIGVSVSPPRSFLMEMTGGKTQFAYIVNAVFILITLFALAPLLEALPICLLACLIMTSCIPLFIHYKASVTYWRTCKYDFSIWLITCLATLCINVEMGMVIGVAFSFMVVIYQSHNPHTSTLGYVSKDGRFLDIKRYETALEIPGIKIYKFDSPIYFATLGVFKEKLFSYTVDPVDMKLYLDHQRHLQKKHSKALIKEAKSNAKMQSANNSAHEMTAVRVKLTEPVDDMEPNHATASTPLKEAAAIVQAAQAQPLDTPYTCVHTIIVDCSGIPFSDTPGVRFLCKFRKDYEGLEIRYVLASLNEQVRSLMSRVTECQDVLNNHSFPSVHDAIIWAQRTHDNLNN